MTARLLDGKALAEKYRADIARRVEVVKGRGGRVRLDAVLVGSADNGARVYAANQGKTCAAVGIEYKLHEIGDAGEEVGFDEIAGRVLLLNTREDVTAVMLHMPLPAGVDAYSVQRLIAPEKDVEGVNPANIGNIVYGRSSLAPCTALAVVKMLDETGVQLRGKRAVVIGASDVVGKPIAVLLMRLDASVISVNKWTGEDRVAAYAREADVVIAAAGVPGLVKAGMVKRGAVVVDVGVNRVAGPGGKTVTVGDVEFEAVRGALGPEGWISPVPGGVGPMTVSMLLLNVVQAAERTVGIG
ncbi:MAG: bifunctional 5,10-methylenetetrahydrofolate dehydrogenase/5,10-methenyltetrahydrofolate cyclohydrolase [Phycisphaerales bacterium]|nr:bifunctional 5,10-methylenetetrahydrofolate dehydrogenase/5,10-methenyltetrahydrofolate cyclohydrolase [Phycisphaerales bacterium]